MVFSKFTPQLWWVRLVHCPVLYTGLYGTSSYSCFTLSYPPFTVSYPCSTAPCLGTAVTVAVVDDIDLVWTGGLTVVANGDLVQPLAW